MCSTRRAIEILEDGISYEDKRFQLPKGKLTVPTANRWLRTMRIRDGRKFRKFVPIHFRAEHSNQLWIFGSDKNDGMADKLVAATGMRIKTSF